MTDVPTCETSLAPLHDVAESSTNDFDFLHGRWHVRNRRRLHPFTGSDAWEEFDAASLVRPLWDGQGHLEEWDARTSAGEIRAVSLQLFDPGARQWRLHWATSHDGRVGTPTVGSFRDGVGQFYAMEQLDGRSILLRIIWQGCGPDACGWEQSFSADGGQSWECNWTMAFSRQR